MMFGGDEGNKRLVEFSGLHLCMLAPAALMGQQGIGELIGPKVHVGLMAVVLARRRVEQREAERCGRRLVPAVLAVAQDGDAVAVRRRAVVGPLVSAHLVLVARTDAVCDGAKRDVVRVVLVAVCEGEVDLEHALVRLPVHLVDALHAVVQGVHADVLHKGGAFLLALHAQRLAQRSVLHKLYLGIARNEGRRRAALVGVADFPCRPGVLVVVDELLTHSGIDEGTVVCDIVEVGDVAAAVHRDAIPPVGHLVRACADLAGKGRGELRLLAKPDVVDGVAKRRDGGLEDEMQAARLHVVARHLGKDFVPVGAEHTDACLHAAHVKRPLDDVRTFVRKRVVDDNGRAFRVCVHLLNDGTNTRGEFLREGSVGKVVLVVGILVGREDARASDAVVMLLPEGTHPGIAQLSGGIVAQAEPHGKGRSLLGSIGQELVLAVPELQGSPARVGPYTVGPHGQSAVPHFVLPLVASLHVLEELVGRGETHADGSVLLRSIVAEPVGCVLTLFVGIVLQGSAAVATRPDIAEHGRQAVVAEVLVYLAQGGGIAGEVLVIIFVLVVGFGFIDSVDAAAVHALPHAEGRQTAISGRAPTELGRVESLLPGMVHEAGQSIGEAEAVGEHDVIAAPHAELLPVEAVGIEHAVQDALGRGHHHVAGIDGHTADVPLPAPHVLLQLLELRGVVLLHPHVLDGALVVEPEVGVLVHELHVVHQGVPDVLRYGGLDVPVPLRVEMRVGDEEEGLLVLSTTESRTA